MNNKQSIKYLYDKYAEQLILISYKILKNYDESQDVVQELFIDLLSGKIKLDYVKDLKAYIIVSVKRTAINVLKKNKPFNVCLDEIENYSVNELDDYSSEIIKIYNEISKMPEQRKKVILKYFNNDCRYKDIAEDLQISTNTVKTHLKLGLKQIRDMKKVNLTITTITIYMSVLNLFV